MNTEVFIARRFSQSKSNKQRFSAPMVRIAVMGIAVGLIVMIIAVSIVVGFKHEIRSKITAFASHLQIVNFDLNESYETKPISSQQECISQIRKMKGISQVQVFAHKPGIIKTKTDMEGVVLKGIGSDFNWSFFSKNLVSGNVFKVTDTAKTDNVLVSKSLADKLNLKLGGKLSMYFIQEGAQPRMRAFKINGIYQTGLEEFDNVFVFCDIAHVRKLNNWDSTQVTGFEIFLNRFDDIDKFYDLVNDEIGYTIKNDGNVLKLVSIKEKYPQLFDWLELQDLNVWIILCLMVIVAGFNMVSGILILILERTATIGLLKALGMQNKSIRRVFLVQAGIMIGKGLLIGNVIGIGLCLLQQKFALFSLDPTVYYVSSVPVKFDITLIVLLNLGTFVVTLLMMVLPSQLISRVDPASSVSAN